MIKNTDSLAPLFQNSPDAVALIAMDGRILYANTMFLELLRNQHNLDDLGTLYDKVLPEKGRVALKKHLNTTGRTGKENQFNLTLSWDGEPNHYFCRAIPWSSTVEDSILLEIRDETETVNLRRELSSRRFSRQQEKLLKERRRNLFFGLLDDLPTSVYLQRRDYTVAFANKKVRKLYGEPEDRLCYEVFPGRTSPCPVCPTFKVFDTGQSEEWEFTDNDGRTFLIYDYPFEDDTGEKLVLEMGFDITQLKQVERELFQAQKLRAIGVLAGGIAHDLNNNLVPIIFNIEYAKGKVSERTVQEPLEDALQAANRAANLVSQVLEYSRQQDVERTSIRLSPLIRECIKEIETTLPENIYFQTNLDVTQDSVLANAIQIQQVVMNLIRNSEQSMPEGGIISVSLDVVTLTEVRENGQPELEPGKYSVLQITDTGLGIREDAIERIFEPFYTSRKGSGGTGMGLAVVYSIVTGSGGRIMVDSTPGIGTTFTVYLPSIAASVDMLQGEFCNLDGRDINILLVDDDPGALTAMARSLGDAGFTIDTATGGVEGLEQFLKDPDRYNLILADQSMPDMNGIEMSKRMFQVKNDARIVICTGHIEPTLEEYAKNQGICGFARKPMSPSSLVKLVKQHCSNSRGE